MGRWIVWLLLAELIFFFWVGLRVQARYEAPVRIIGHAPPSELAPDRTGPRSPWTAA